MSCCLLLQQSSSRCYDVSTFAVGTKLGERLSLRVGNEGSSMNCTLQICQSSKWVVTTWLVSIILLFFLAIIPISCTLLSSCFGCCLLTCIQAQAIIDVK